MPEPRTRPDSVDTLEFLVTVTVYADCVVPSCAVTTVVITLAPTASEINPLAAPDATIVPFTLIVAVVSVTVGLTVMDVVVFGTLDV